LFTITDNGKGMSINEIINFFLNVGNSYRRSLSWKKEFIDETGSSLVNRNGKFGIGVLAAFLLGNELKVKTKNYKENIIYSFKTRIDSEYIEINKDILDEFDTGTTISIEMSNSKVKELTKLKYRSEINWYEWYVYDFPKIKFYYNGEKIENRSKVDSSIFNVFTIDNFEKIEWHYSDGFLKNNWIDVEFVCNGILVTKSTNKTDFDISSTGNIITKIPNLLIHDKEGIFPLKLDRNDIDCDVLPFEEKLLTEVSKEYIAQILSLQANSENIKKEIFLKHKAELLYHKSGFSLNFDYFIGKLKSKVSFIKIILNTYKFERHLLNNQHCVFFPVFGEKIKLSYQEGNVAPKSGGRILLRTKKFTELFSDSNNRLPKYIKKNTTIESTNSDFTIYNYNNFLTKSSYFINEKSLSEEKFLSVESVQEIDFNYFSLVGGDILNGLLEKYIGDNVIIPYDVELRKKLYSKAFHLNQFVCHH